MRTTRHPALAESPLPSSDPPRPRARWSMGLGPMRLGPGREALLVVAFLVVLTAGFFSPLLQGARWSIVPAHHNSVFPWAGLPPNQVPAAYPQSDQADLSYPWQVFLTRTVEQGSFPFWDPYSYGGGYPFFANGSSATLYPPRLLAALLVDPPRAHELFEVFHVLVSGLVMYALMRELRAGPAGSLLAAVSWMFAGWNMAWLHLEVVTPMSVFLPLGALLVHRAFRIRSPASAVWAGLGLGLTLVSGHLVLLGIVYLVAVTYATALAASRMLTWARAGQWRRGLPDLVRLAAIGAISVGSAMALLLPTAYALGDSHRDPFTYEELTRSFLAPVRTFLLYSFVPPPLPVTQETMHEMAFAGTATALLAVVGLFLRRRGATMGRVLLATTIAVAVGTPATWFAYRFVPGFDVFRPYSRLVAFSSFAVAVLGGLGLDALLARVLRAADRGGPGRRALLRGLAVAGAIVVIGATTLQVARYGRDVNPRFVPEEVASFFPPTPLTAALGGELLPEDGWPGRFVPVRITEPGVAWVRPTLFGTESLVFGFDTTGGYDSVVPRRVTAMIRVLQGSHPEEVLHTGLPAAYAPVFESSATRFDLMERLGVTALATSPESVLETALTTRPGLPPTEVVYDGPDGRVLRVVGASAAPYLVHAQEVVPTGDDALRRFLASDFDFRRTVVLEAGNLPSGRAASTGDPAPAGAGADGVLAAQRWINDARVTVTSASPAWLVFHESWSPGWTATVNGRPTEVVRANYAKRAVRVPAGQSVVELSYRPPGLTMGAAVTGVTLLACGAALAAAPLRRRRRPTGAGEPVAARR